METFGTLSTCRPCGAASPHSAVMGKGGKHYPSQKSHCHTALESIHQPETVSGTDQQNHPRQSWHTACFGGGTTPVDEDSATPACSHSGGYTSTTQTDFLCLRHEGSGSFWFSLSGIQGREGVRGVVSWLLSSRERRLGRGRQGGLDNCSFAGMIWWCSLS